MDHDAIYRAYPDVVKIDSGTGAYDKNDNLVSLDQSKIDAARVTLDAEAAAVKYKTDRTEDGSTIYASFGDQLDMLYADRHGEK